MDVGVVLAIGIALLSIAGMVVRPWRSSEWMWAAGGALAEIAAGAISGRAAWNAVLGGADVYAFLVGILMLAEAARSQGVFEWLAGRAIALAGPSRARLLALCYGAGVVVTAVLSNDTAIIVLTPAALVLARRLGGSPLPFLFACAFVANAASFLLPTGNPANLLLYGAHPPALVPWLEQYGAAACAAIVVTYVALAWSSRAELVEPVTPPGVRVPSTPGVKAVLALWLASAAALVAASAFALPLGATALACGLGTSLALVAFDPRILRTVAAATAWSVVPLVAGLLVVVAAMERAGAATWARYALDRAALLPPPLGHEAVGFATALAANAANNLPVAAFAADALAGGPAHAYAHAVLIGIDLGPNLTVTGSLATILWLMILRRDGVVVTSRHFFFRGAVVMLPALFVALLLTR